MNRVRRWILNHPRSLERIYAATARAVQALTPLLSAIGYSRLEPLFEAGERATKGPLFGCRMCGMCSLHSTGMTCPMTCPKQMRNGPCGGVRPDGKCEVKPEMDCVWALAWQRAASMPRHGPEIRQLQPPLDYGLAGSSAWLNMIRGRDRVEPSGWMRQAPMVDGARESR